MQPVAFDYDDDKARSALVRMGRAPVGPVGLETQAWQQGAMGALLHAELMAATAGVVPWLVLPDGQKGVIVGEAREHIGRAPRDVRALYLATHGLVRATHARAKPLVDGDAPMLGQVQLTIGVALLVVGIAALVATAVYKVSAIEVAGRNVRSLSLIDALLQLARGKIARGEPIDPELYSAFEKIAETEQTPLPWWVVAAGVGAAAAGGALAFRLTQGERGATGGR